MIFEHAGFDEPAGFKWANGQALGRTAYARLFASLTKEVTGTTTNSSVSVTGVSADLTASVAIGMPISGTNIQAGTTVAGITVNTITLSLAATASATSTLTIAPHGVGDGSTTFNVPDRRGRVGVGRDNMGGSAASRMTTAGGGVNGILLGHAAGGETHTLTAAQIPAHAHPLASGGAGNGSGAYTNFWQGTGPSSGTNTSNNVGGGGAHPIVQPSYVCNYVIKT